MKIPRRDIDNTAYMPYTIHATHRLLFYEKRDRRCQVKNYLRAQNKAVRGEAGC